MWSIYTSLAWEQTQNRVQIMTYFEKNTINTVIRHQFGYPTALEKLSSPPEMLRIRGCLGNGPCVGIVGSRKADNASIRFAFSLSEELAGMGFCIVSGGALGIDTAAHKGALQAKGITVSVIGSGFNYLYPVENKDLFEEIAVSGALVSEFDDEQPPAKWTFPKRNRIVAALSDALIVVQAPERSGALITAEIAKDIGIPIGAVPSFPQDLKNRGAHNLIRQGAALIENIDDVLKLVASKKISPQLSLPGIGVQKSVFQTVNDGVKSSASPLEKRAMGDTFSSPSTAAALSKTEKEILNYLCTEPLHIDEITSGLKILPSQTATAILTLELQGLIEDRGGRNFVRVG